MRGLLLDSNLLVLLVVGLTNEGLISSHKALSAYNLLDLNALKREVDAYDTLCVTPNTLTECSNLSRQISGDAKRGISLTLARLLGHATELYIKSIEVCKGEDYARLGLTDAVLLALMDQRMTLLTADFDLYLAACAICPERAFNFNHFPHRASVT